MKYEFYFATEITESTERISEEKTTNKQGGG
jgi:hypothetical protein